MLHIHETDLPARLLQRDGVRMKVRSLSISNAPQGMMANEDNQHVVRRGDEWAVRGAGNSRDTSHHDTQSEASDAARDTAKNKGSDVVIHGRDGSIRERNSYGNDPERREG